MQPFDLSQQQDHIESKIVVALERISEAFRVMLWQHSKDHALSPIQIQILIFCHFHQHDMCKVGYLAKEFNMTKATVSDSVKVLAEKGLISKQVMPNDSRSYWINLTDKGEQMVVLAAPFATEMLQAVQQLSSLEKTNIFSSLLRIIDHLNQKDIISIQRMCHTCMFYDRRMHGPYCTFLKKPLKDKELRIDCPEHKANDR